MNTESSISKNLMEKNTETTPLEGKEFYEHKKGKKELLRKKRKKAEKLKDLKKKAIVSAVIIAGMFAIGGGLFWFTSNRPNLPTTSTQGHIEASPPSHILTNPMPISIQGHMLEHADGAGKPGIIIQYNCDDYKCEGDLIDKLIDIVKEYPENVYLAPNTYDGKIILTKIGQREILDAFDAQAIGDFIEN